MSKTLVDADSTNTNYSLKPFAWLRVLSSGSKKTLSFLALTVSLAGAFLTIKNVWFTDGDPIETAQVMVEQQTTKSVAATIKKLNLFPPHDITYVPYFDRAAILRDSDNRISSEFQVPAALKTRVGFWFDVYTRYNSNQRLIHHSKYPWVVFRILDVSGVINTDKPKFKWMRVERAEKIVKKERDRLEGMLKKIAKTKSLDKLSLDEIEIVNLLSSIDKNPRLAAAEAARSLRIQVGQRDFFGEGLKIAGPYLPVLEEVFRRNRLPVELTRLPLVESSFNRLATSKAGAAGIWQFIGDTGKKYLIVDGMIDERRSPVKSTEAAADLLKENFTIMKKSWPLAITAYNHGPGGVRKAVRIAKTNDLAEIIKKYQSRSFSFATSNYYSEFLAALYAEEYKKEIFGEESTNQVLAFGIVELVRPVRPSSIIKKVGISKEKLLEFNPDLKSAIRMDSIIPSGFELHVPSDLEIKANQAVGVEQISRADDPNMAL